jgi:signal transduction histidine kinase
VRPTQTVRTLVAGGDNRAWQLRVRHQRIARSDVAQSRRRSLAIGLGVLGLLGAAFILMIAARGQQRLARQQMEFVAAVSHELRTPLAVICSAGENLADGVVADWAQVKRYGSLSRPRAGTSGTRSMRQFAGISSSAPISSGGTLMCRG